MAELSAGELASVQRIKEKVKAQAKESAVPETSEDNATTIRGPLILISVLLTGAALWAAQAIVVPTVMAVVLALVLTPIVARLEAWHLPTSVATFVVVLIAAAMLAGTALALAPGVADWMRRAPEISRTVERKLQPFKEGLATVQEASHQLEKITNVGGDGSKVVVAPDAGGSILETAPGAVAQTLYVVVLALFLIGSRKIFRKRLVLLSSERENRLRVLRIMNESLDQVSAYLFTLMCVSIGLALVTAVCFWIAGIEYALLWGVAFGIACIIPYLGPTAVIVICALVQFATQETLADAAVAPLILLAINTVESNLVTPMLVSRRTSVSALAIFVAVASFVWLWGPAASILAVPILILFHAIAKHVPSLQPYAILLQAENDETPVSPSAPKKRFATEGDASQEPRTWRGYFVHLGRTIRGGVVAEA